MKINYECASCMLRQSREAIEHSTDDIEERMNLTLKVLNFMNENFKNGRQSNKLGTRLHHFIMNETGINDPYKNLREQGNKIAEKLIPFVEDEIKIDASLETFCRIAVAGNVIDFGSYEEDTDMESIIINQISRKPMINDVDKLDEALEKSDTLLYLADNGGEIVFDKMLIQKIKKDYDVDIILALKDRPILNDALLDDAKRLNLGKYCELISTGANSVGIVEEYISDKMIELMDDVDLIISKGMGNFEGLTEMSLETPIFFMLTTKCNVISREIGVPLGSPVIVRKILSN